MNKIDLQFKELPYAIEEAMNKLRVNVRFCGSDTKRIMITSALPNEGKSSVSFNLWKMLAEAGYPSVLVDGDLRKSTLRVRHEMNVMGTQLDIGYYLSGQAQVMDVLYKTNVKNGFIVPCLNNLENPSTLFEDTKFTDLLEKLEAHFRYVIIDSPPLQLVSDGMQIANVCDGAILVVKSGSTPKKLIKSSLELIEHSDCKLLGCVLNQVETGSRSYYGKYYGHYYGSNEKKGGK